MYQKLCSIDVAGQQHSDAPFAEERERYLRHCMELGATPAALCLNSNELAWIARYLDPSAGQGIDMEMFLRIVQAISLAAAFFDISDHLHVTATGPTPCVSTARAKPSEDNERSQDNHSKRDPMLLPRLIVTLGGNIAVVCFRLRSPLD
jgi:hypothetical protein